LGYLSGKILSTAPTRGGQLAGGAYTIRGGCDHAEIDVVTLNPGDVGINYGFVLHPTD
jgi:hypothetical protein